MHIPCGGNIRWIQVLRLDDRVHEVESQKKNFTEQKPEGVLGNSTF